MAVDLTNDLYRLIEAELLNDNRHQEMKVLEGRVFMSPVLFPAFGKAPYVVVTPGGETGDPERGENRDLSVIVWVVSSIMRDAYSKPELLGQVGITDGGTLVRAVRKVLAGVRPFQDNAIFGAAPYPSITQARRDQILACHYESTGGYEVVPDPKSDPEEEILHADMHLARPLTMIYEMVEVD